MRCPECNSKNLGKHGRRWHKVGNRRVKRQQYICNNCGRITIHPRR